MTMNVRTLIALVMSLAMPPILAASFYSDGRCRDGCDYYAGDTAHISVVEKYHLGKARAKVLDKQYKYAMNDLNFILRHFPNHPQALMLLDDVGRGMGQPDLPLRYFEAAIEAYPDRAATYILYGVFLQKRGKIGDAIAQYEHGLSLNPNQPDGHYNLGLALVKTKRYAEANEHAVAAYRLGHPMPGLRNQLRRVGAWNPGAVPAPAPAKTDAAEPAEVDETVPSASTAVPPAPAQP
jgi:tetratricopeptide (TPR) repeat protein